MSDRDTSLTCIMLHTPLITLGEFDHSPYSIFAVMPMGCRNGEYIPIPGEAYTHIDKGGEIYLPGGLAISVMERKLGMLTYPLIKDSFCLLPLYMNNNYKQLHCMRKGALFLTALFRNVNY